MHNMYIIIIITLSFHYLTPTPSFGFLLGEGPCNLLLAIHGLAPGLHPPINFLLELVTTSHLVGCCCIVLMVGLLPLAIR